MSAPQTRVLIIGDQFGMPRGRAATNYVTLLARGLHAAGAQVSILLAKFSEADSTSALNSKATGEVDVEAYGQTDVQPDGMPFEYATGGPVIPRSRLLRTLANLRSMVVIALRLISLSRSRSTAVLLYAQSPEVVSWVKAWARLLSLPVFPHVVEWPSAFPGGTPKERTAWNRYTARIFDGAAGAVVISTFLVERAEEAAAGQGITLPILRLPVLADKDAWAASSGASMPERASAPSDPRERYLLYCGSVDNYLGDVEFLLRAAARAQNDAHLVLVGQASQGNIESLRSLCRSLSLPDFTIHGYLPHAELLRLYSGAAALLAPVHSDARSAARFPSKIAEYLMSAAPVVTTAYGEIPEYLSDGVDAFVAPTDSIEDFAGKIDESLTDPERSARIGLAGREVATMNFDYRMAGQLLLDFLEQNTSTPSRKAVDDE